MRRFMLFQAIKRTFASLIQASLVLVVVAAASLLPIVPGVIFLEAAFDIPRRTAFIILGILEMLVVVLFIQKWRTVLVDRIAPGRREFYAASFPYALALLLAISTSLIVGFLGAHFYFSDHSAGIEATMSFVPSNFLPMVLLGMAVGAAIIVRTPMWIALTLAYPLVAQGTERWLMRRYHDAQIENEVAEYRATFRKIQEATRETIDAEHQATARKVQDATRETQATARKN